MPYPFQLTSPEAYQAAYTQSIEQPEAFWAGVAQHFQWRRPWDKVLEWNFETPRIEWFSGARLNITENCLDRHLATQGDTPAIIWEPNNPNDATRTLTYRELHLEVCSFAQVLTNNGVQKGDVVPGK